jgi:uncharacterized protein (UPF0147 family)
LNREIKSNMLNEISADKNLPFYCKLSSIVFYKHLS